MQLKLLWKATALLCNTLPGQPKIHQFETHGSGHSTKFFNRWLLFNTCDRVSGAIPKINDFKIFDNTMSAYLPHLTPASNSLSSWPNLI